MTESSKTTSNRSAPANQIQNAHALVYFFNILQSLRIVSKTVYFETTHIITKRYLLKSFHHVDDDEFISRLLFGRHPNLSDYEWNLLRPLRRRRDVILQRYLCRGAKHVPESVNSIPVKEVESGNSPVMVEKSQSPSAQSALKDASKKAPKTKVAPKPGSAVKPAENSTACVEIEMTVVDGSSPGSSCTSKEPKCEKQQVGKTKQDESSPTKHVCSTQYPSVGGNRRSTPVSVTPVVGNGMKHKMTTSESENVVSDGGSRGAKPRRKTPRLAKSSSNVHAVENVQSVTKSNSVFLEEIANGLKASFSDIVKTSLSTLKDEVTEASKSEICKFSDRLINLERQYKQVLNRNEQLVSSKKVSDYLSTYSKPYPTAQPSMEDIFKANCLTQGTGGAKSKPKKKSSNVK